MWNEVAEQIMQSRFGHDCLIALATTDEKGMPYVRTVNAYYESGAFYIITHLLSQKMKQIKQRADVAVCGDWFTGHGVAVCLGHIMKDANCHIADKLRKAFAAWYQNGHVQEEDPNTCILKIEITHGVLFSHGTRYEK